MQKLNVHIVKEINSTKMKKLEDEMKDIILVHQRGEIFICPYCNYESRKNKKGSAKLFQDNNGTYFKCFSCGKWRVV